MAYSSITKPGDHFNTVLYTGNATDDRSISGVGFQPDWLWLKRRDNTGSHRLVDAIRGATKTLSSNSNSGEGTEADVIQAFETDGFQIGGDSASNANSGTFASWNWKAGGTAPSVTYTVKVVSDSGNKYRFDDFGTSAVTLELQEGGTYTFDQSDSSNATHPLRFYTAADKTGGEYTTGVTTTGTPGSSGAQTVITVAASAPTLYYQCSSHSGMGGQANTNSLFGSSNFAGGTQSTVSVNSTAGFSIINWAGSSSASVQTIGHGLGATPHWILSKNRGSGSSITAWINYHHKIDASAPEDYTIYLNNTDARNDNTVFNDTAPTSTVFSFNTGTDDQNYISYCFTEKKGYSKFGKYTGNGNANGPFVYTGFKPAFVMTKRTDGAGDWAMMDNKRPNEFNVVQNYLKAQANDAEQTDDSFNIDILSNGWKARYNNGNYNASGGAYIYMAFAENPFVANDSGTAIPTTAR